MVLVQPEMLETEFLGELDLAHLLPEQLDMADTFARVCRRPDRELHLKPLSPSRRGVPSTTRQKGIIPASNWLPSPFLQTARFAVSRTPPLLPECDLPRQRIQGS